MDVIRTLKLDTPAVKRFKKYYIFSTLALVLFVLLEQIYQDFIHKQEYLDAQRIHLYQKQASLNGVLLTNLLALREGDLATTDVARRQVLSLITQSKLLQAELKAVKQQRHQTKTTQRIEKAELLVTSYVNQLLASANQAMTIVEAGQLADNAQLSALYEQMLLNYRLYQDSNGHLIEGLSYNLQADGYTHRRILWLVISIFMMLVLTIGTVSYRIAKALAQTQSELVEKESQRRKKNDQDMLDQMALMHAGQMKMRSILDSTVDSIITITLDGRIDSFNKAAEKMFGYSASEMIGQNVKLLIPEGYDQEHGGHSNNYKNAGEPKSVGSGRELVGQCKDKSQFPVYLSVSEVPDSEPRLFTGIVSDMTEHKKSSDKLKQLLTELRSKQAQLEQEEKIAAYVFSTITANSNDTLPQLASWIVPMGTFSGDMMLSGLLPSGATRVVLCDFTGHGLPAALGAMPVSSVHRAMIKSGLPLETLMGELNDKLKELLPTGIFCCIVGIDVDAIRSRAHIWNAGLPEVLVVSKSGVIKHRIKSTHLPLGVVKYKADEMHCIDVALEVGDSIYAYSDGLTEAENSDGEMFGQQRFEELLSVAVEDGDRMASIQNIVNVHINNSPPRDDLSLLQIKNTGHG